MNQQDKSYFLERVSREMDQDLGVLDLSPREALAACCRILAHEGHESGLAGQVTALGERPGTWWTLRFGLGFEEATPERMVLVDEDLRPLSGGGATSTSRSTSRLWAPSSGPGHSVPPGVSESLGTSAGILSGRPPTSTVSNMPRALHTRTDRSARRRSRRCS